MKTRKVKIKSTGEVGTFLEFGIGYDFSYKGKRSMNPITVAIVELERGDVKTAGPEDIEFVPEPGDEADLQEIISAHESAIIELTCQVVDLEALLDQQKGERPEPERKPPHDNPQYGRWCRCGAALMGDHLSSCPMNRKERPELEGGDAITEKEIKEALDKGTEERDAFEAATPTGGIDPRIRFKG